MTAQNEDTVIVQSATAQFALPFPAVLAVTSFTNHIEILNRCKSNEERVFYMLYSYRERLKLRELRRCIVNQTYSTLLDKEKMLSPQLLRDYPSSEYLLKDKALVDFLSASCPHPCLAVARYALTSLTLLWLGIENELSLLSLYATFASDVANLLESNTNLA